MQQLAQNAKQKKRYTHMAAVKKVAACTEMLKKHLRLALFSGAGGGLVSCRDLQI